MLEKTFCLFLHNNIKRSKAISSHNKGGISGLEKIQAPLKSKIDQTLKTIQTWLTPLVK